MKKKLTRVLLSVCIVAMLICSLTASAFAIETQQYKMLPGDTVLSVCNKLGIDFYANQDWIKATNNITNWNKIPVGKVLTLPKGKVATTATATPTTTAAIPTVVTGVTASGLMEGDYIVSYLINHRMQAGETVGALCAAYGTDFSANAETIKTLSGITSWNRIPVGKVVVIPSAFPPTSGESYTAIVAHRVRAGETVGSICNHYGLNYGTVAETLKTLNKKQNLNVIHTGEIFYLPVGSGMLGTISGGVGGTGTGTTGTTITPATGTVSPTNTTSAPHGSFRLQVNGVDVTTAVAGQTVTIVATPEPGYEVDKVTIMKVGGGDYVIPNGMTFIMPNYAISVQVTFKPTTSIT